MMPGAGETEPKRSMISGVTQLYEQSCLTVKHVRRSNSILLTLCPGKPPLTFDTMWAPGHWVESQPPREQKMRSPGTAGKFGEAGFDFVGGM